MATSTGRSRRLASLASTLVLVLGCAKLTAQTTYSAFARCVDRDRLCGWSRELGWVQVWSPGSSAMPLQSYLLMNFGDVVLRLGNDNGDQWVAVLDAHARVQLEEYIGLAGPRTEVLATALPGGGVVLTNPGLGGRTFLPRGGADSPAWLSAYPKTCLSPRVLPAGQVFCLESNRSGNDSQVWEFQDAKWSVTLSGSPWDRRSALMDPDQYEALPDGSIVRLDAGRLTLVRASESIELSNDVSWLGALQDEPVFSVCPLGTSGDDVHCVLMKLGIDGEVSRIPLDLGLGIIWSGSQRTGGGLLMQIESRSGLRWLEVWREGTEWRSSLLCERERRTGP